MSAAQTASPQFDVQSLYSEHQRWLFCWLRRKLGCEHHAADLTQDTFMRLLVSREALVGIKEPRAYLTTTAKRLIVDQARRRTLEQAYLAEAERVAAALPGSPSAEEVLMAVQALEQICRALEQVPAKAREAFLLHYLDLQTHADIAQQLGVSIRMVQKYLVQVLVQCQKHCAALAVSQA